MAAPVVAPPREAILKVAAWLVHLYTASGAVAALMALRYIARDDFRSAFIVMAVAILIDATDGTLARSIRIRERLPLFDGATLDNIVDYLNYVAVPVFLMLRAPLLPSGNLGLAIAGFVMIASAYGFCRVDAKTSDFYFRGFPSYWNLVAFYLFILAWPARLNAIVVTVLAIMVFVPIKYIYPNRTVPMRAVTLSFAVIWACATLGLVFDLPRHNALLLYTSLAFVVYYLAMSMVLHCLTMASNVLQMPRNS